MSALIVIIFCMVLKGLAIQLNWGWFIVPVFDIPQLPLAASIGLSGLVSLMVGVYDEDADKNFIEKVAFSIIFPIGIIFSGWIVHFFMP